MPPTPQKDAHDEQRQADHPLSQGRPVPAAAAVGPLSDVHVSTAKPDSFHRCSSDKCLSAHCTGGAAPGSEHHRPRVPASEECARSGKEVWEDSIKRVTGDTLCGENTVGAAEARALPPPSRPAPRSSAWVGTRSCSAPSQNRPGLAAQAPGFQNHCASRI